MPSVTQSSSPTPGDVATKSTWEPMRTNCSGNELAGPGEIWASGTAFGTVVGSGLRFQMKGDYPLKGVPGTWPAMRLLG